MNVDIYPSMGAMMHNIFVYLMVRIVDRARVAEVCFVIGL